MCQDHQNLNNFGFYPTSFAYPFGAYDANAESIVSGCGYTAGRAAGGIDVAGRRAGAGVRGNDSAQGPAGHPD